jgi:hypothetical protein
LIDVVDEMHREVLDVEADLLMLQTVRACVRACVCSRLRPSGCLQACACVCARACVWHCVRASVCVCARAHNLPQGEVVLTVGVEQIADVLQCTRSIGKISPAQPSPAQPGPAIQSARFAVGSRGSDRHR